MTSHEKSTAAWATVMARQRRTVLFIGLILAALALMGAVYHRSSSGGQGDTWASAIGGERYTATDNTHSSLRVEEGIRPVNKMQPLESVQRDLKVLPTENDRISAGQDPTAQDGDQSSHQEDKPLFQVPSEQSTGETTDGSDDEESDSSGSVVNSGAKATADDRLEKTPDFADSLSRLASTLDFDYSSCPKGSLVHTPSPATTLKPKHADCPSLFIIGARKGGTTSLIQYLSKHPHFVGARLGGNAKAGETMYYTSLYGKRDWAYYMSFFPPPTPGVLTGESSVAYATRCLVPSRIVEDCGTKPKIVYLIRNPYRRFESNYLMRLKFNPKYLDINKLFQKEWNVLMKAFNGSMNVDGEIKKGASLYEDFSCKWEAGTPNMLYESVYFVFLSHWLCNYPSPENIMIVNSEEFFEKPGRIMNQIFGLLGLDELSEEDLRAIVSSVYNQGTHRDAGMSDESKKLIKRLYSPFTKEILTLLKWDVDWSL